MQPPIKRLIFSLFASFYFSPIKIIFVFLQSIPFTLCHTVTPISVIRLPIRGRNADGLPFRFAQTQQIPLYSAANPFARGVIETIYPFVETVTFP